MLDPVIVPGRPATDGITWLTLARAKRQPVIRVREDDQAQVTCLELARLSQGMGAFLVAVTGLKADSSYTLLLTDDDGREAAAQSRTLPASLTPGQPFTIALGSCYNWPMDLKEVYRWFPPVRHQVGAPDPLRLRFLLGDQIYMDLEKSVEAHKPNSWSKPLVRAPDPWNAYQEQWTDRRYRNFFLKGGCSSLFLGDDHDMWNDYPHKPLWLPWTKGDGVAALERELKNAFDVFQASLNVAPATVAGATSLPHSTIRSEGLTFRLDIPPLTFFVLDTRMGRSRADTTSAPAFTDPNHLNEVVDWLGTPGGFGILAVAAPVFQGKGSAFDHNLADYQADYKRLVDALSAARRSVLILSGDIHYCRLYTLALAGGAGGSLAEFVSSPLARLKEPPGERPPHGEDVVRGTLGDSGAQFVLESTDGQPGTPFVTTERQTYGTVTFTLAADGSNSLQTVMSCWGPARKQRDGAELLLQRTLSWSLAAR